MLEVTIKEKNKNNKDLTDEDAREIIELVLDCLIEVGNGTTDEILHECANYLFKFRDNWLYDKVKYSNSETLINELKLYKEALTKSISLPKGELPSTNKYYTVLLNGNAVVKKHKEG